MSYKGFTKLPNEVLEQIALAILDEKVDDHDEEGGEDEGDDKQRHRNGTCHLATFARLDKHIYEVATPLLYNKIDVSTSVARPLLETVLKNKKLAELVREITFTFSGFLEDGSDYHSETLTTTQMTLFGRALQDALAGTMRYDGRDPTALLDGDSPAAEAGLLLHALPNLVSMHFGDYESETFHSVFRCYRDISSTVFRRCIAGIFSENPRAVPAAMLSLETFDLSGSLNGRDGGETVWDIDWVAPFFYCPNIRSISIGGARSAYPYVTNHAGERLEGSPPSMGDDILVEEFVHIDSDGEEDGLNGECNYCRKSENQIQGTLKRCSKCKKRAYCSKECQTAEWPRHKKACKKDKMHHKFPRHVDINKPKSTALESLGLWVGDLHPKVLRTILSLPRALKEFNYTPDPFVHQDGGHLPMKPQLFQLALEEQQDSLEQLEVDLRLYRQESLMSLRHFTSLRCLRIEALLLIWRSSHPKSFEVPLNDTLPTSLKILELDFFTWSSKTPFWAKKGLRSVDSNMLEGLDFHLRSIAQRSQPLDKLVMKFPKLDLHANESEMWKPYNEVRALAEGLFEPIGTELEVRVGVHGI